MSKDEHSAGAHAPKRLRLSKSLRLAKSEESDEALNGRSSSVCESPSWPSRSDDLAVYVNSIKSGREEEDTTDHDCKITPIAARLSDYLAPGGTTRFRPRLEWLTSHGAPSRKRPRSPAAADDQEEEDEQEEQIQEQPPQQEAQEPVVIPPGQAPNDGQLPNHLFLEFFFGQPIARISNEANRIIPGNVDSAAAAAAPVAVAESTEEANCTGRSIKIPSFFGRDRDSALHVAIRESSTEAAVELIELGAPVGVHNVKRVTPLILAAQKGNHEVAKTLLEHGANPLCTSITGSTALLQAAHFGHDTVVNLLLEYGSAVEAANFKNTTPLMRASQEGHEDVVRILLEKSAEVNRRNNEYMSALMLASQRGHDHIVRMLLDYNADVDAMTAQKSTSLMLACKRENLDVVRVLVTAGCELHMRDSRGRTARDVAMRKGCQDIVKLLAPAKQVELMQRHCRVERNYTIVKMWTLLQQDRATLLKDGRSIHAVAGNEATVFVGEMALASNEALVRTMNLPAPLVEHIASYIPLSSLWDERIALLTKRCGVDADLTVSCTLDLIDEVLEEGHFLHACDMATITPPPHFSSWQEWSSWGFRHNHLDPRPVPAGRANVLTATLPGLPSLERGIEPPPPKPMNARDWRRGICYLQILAHRTPLLAQLLNRPPFSMPHWVVDQLIAISDIQSLSRRMGAKGARFDATVAIEVVMLASSVVSWYHSQMKWQERGPVLSE